MEAKAKRRLPQNKETASFYFHIAKFHTVAEKGVLNTIQLIDMLWFQKETNNVIAASEVKKAPVYIQEYYGLPTCHILLPIVTRYCIW